MTLPTEPIGSIPRPPALIDGMRAAGEGLLGSAALEILYDDAVQDTLRRFEETGSPVVTDGEQRKQSFATYPVAGLTNRAAADIVLGREVRFVNNVAYGNSEDGHGIRINDDA